jgi:hypothetical protein
MKTTFIFLVTFLVTLTGLAQTDSTREKTDTLHVGNFIIIQKNKPSQDKNVKESHTLTITMGPDTPSFKKKKRSSNINTNWWIMDLGFANFRDNTNYAAAQGMGYFKTVNGSPVNQNSFTLNTGKSSNVNIWFFMQKLNITRHVLNLKYGLGLEMYNFRYDHNLSYRNSPAAYVFNDTIDFSKNKLYAGYLTVPLMLHVNTTPTSHRGFSFSAGLSAGYLVGSHAKQISPERGKQKYHGDLGLRPWRLAGITELGLGPVRLYGSYSFDALHKKTTGVSQFPYAVGIRLSNW